MRVYWLITGILVAAVGITQSVGAPNNIYDEDYLQMSADELTPSEDIQAVSKRDLEFNQYVPAYRRRTGEPSCEELRTMWRLSKREARRATSTNNLPRARPYSYGRLMAFAPSSHARPLVYGEARNFAGKGGSMSPVKGAFKQLIGMLGIGGGRPGRPGSFTRMRTMVAADKPPGQTIKGKYNELRDMVLDYHLDKSSPKEVVQVSPVRSPEVYQPVRRALSTTPGDDPQPYDEAKLLRMAEQNMEAGLTPQDWRLANWNYQNRLSCLDVRETQCKRNSDCACAGQYRCNKGRCKVLTMHPDRPRNFLLRKALLAAAGAE